MSSSRDTKSHLCLPQHAFPPRRCVEERQQGRNKDNSNTLSRHKGWGHLTCAFLSKTGRPPRRCVEERQGRNEDNSNTLSGKKPPQRLGPPHLCLPQQDRPPTTLVSGGKDNKEGTRTTATHSAALELPHLCLPQQDRPPTTPVCGGKENKEGTRTTATHSAATKVGSASPGQQHEWPGQAGADCCRKQWAHWSSGEATCCWQLQQQRREEVCVSGVWKRIHLKAGPQISHPYTHWCKEL
ncbi:uncharacterized protein LOC126999154 [Eriocheir sinensis]|uniref:uncharacterized protein LOC126999154 n=1 Tax=Eriocheir sinensis TaxID=95602 RepID=UPI0021CA46A7|nr:uncharacterized protein LOC126999154 [Eriocheir sinensis]